MTRLAHTQSGMTLMELLIAMAIATLLVAPLGAAVLGALRAQSVAGEANDVAQQARFALQRMEAAVRRTAPHTLSTKSASTTADWLDAVAYCRNGAAQLIETTSADAGCTGTRIVADRVSAFTVQSFSAGPGASAVIEIALTIAGASGQSVSLTARTRLGGGTL